MKLFVLVSRVPYPLEKGDKLRAYHQIKRLSKHHEVMLCCLNDDDLHPEAEKELKAICHQLEIIKLNKARILMNLFFAMFSNQPFQVKYFYQRGAQKRINQLIDQFHPDHIYCQLIRSSEYVKNQHNYPKTIDYMDAFSKGVERRITKAPWYLRWVFKSEAKRLLAYENIIFEYFDFKTIISHQDRDLIYHPNRNDIKIILNGVDTDFFHHMPHEKEYDLVFTGNMSYPPNVESVEYLVKEIMPLVQQKRPGINLLISGVNPAPSVKALASDHITVSGWVDDIRTSYASARIFIAPMQIGTGLQNKLLEAMAMHLPCITSPLANNALGAVHNESILIGAQPDEYAACIIRLLEDEALSEKIASNGHLLVKSKFNWEATTDELSNLMAEKVTASV